ncbi:MAG TPA: hypothetical protein VJ398_00110 [Acidimicrobiia bacterium]|nr:hypothetical protein [Acidimicrobiia bacterium]
MVEYCGVCASEEYTESQVTEDGRHFVVCSSPFHGDEPRIWEPTTRLRSGSHEGIGAELLIWDKLLECVIPGEAFVPYGTVEDRLGERYPEDLARLIHEYGHRWRDPAHPGTRYSASVYLGARLSELAKEGHLEHRSGPAEGPWAYNGTYEWWRRTG